MSSERDRTKKWQFSLRNLLLTAACSQVLIGLACGAFGDASQTAFLAVLAVVAVSLGLGFLMVSAVALMFAIGTAVVFVVRLLEDDDD